MKKEEPLFEIRTVVDQEETVDIDLIGNPDYILSCLCNLISFCSAVVDVSVDELLAEISDCIEDMDITSNPQITSIDIDEDTIEEALNRYLGGAES